MSERAASKGRASVSEDLDLDPKASSKQHVDSGDVDEDSTLLGDDAKAPPRRASVGWSTESAASDDKAGGEGAAASSAAASAAGNEGKRGGRRRRGSDNAGNSGGGDGKNAKNRYFDEDGDSTGATHGLILQELVG